MNPCGVDTTYMSVHSGQEIDLILIVAETGETPLKLFNKGSL